MGLSLTKVYIESLNSLVQQVKLFELQIQLSFNVYLVSGKGPKHFASCRFLQNCFPIIGQNSLNLNYSVTKWLYMGIHSPPMPLLQRTTELGFDIDLSAISDDVRVSDYSSIGVGHKTNLTAQTGTKIIRKLSNIRPLNFYASQTSYHLIDRVIVGRIAKVSKLKILASARKTKILSSSKVKKISKKTNSLYL